MRCMTSSSSTIIVNINNVSELACVSLLDCVGALVCVTLFVSHDFWEGGGGITVANYSFFQTVFQGGILNYLTIFVFFCPDSDVSLFKITNCLAIDFFRHKK